MATKKSTKTTSISKQLSAAASQAKSLQSTLNKSVKSGQIDGKVVSGKAVNKTSSSVGGVSSALTQMSIDLAKGKEPVTLSSNQGQKIVDTKITPALEGATAALNGASQNKQKQKEEEQASGLDEYLKDNTDTVQDKFDNSKFVKDYEKSVQQLTLANKEAASAQLSGLSTQYQDVRNQQSSLNKSAGEIYKMSQLRSGESRYAPEVASGNLQSFQGEGLRKLKVIDDEYNAAAAEIRSAMKAENYKLAAQKAETLAKLEDSFQKEIKTQREEATKMYNQNLIVDTMTKENLTDKASLAKRLGKDVPIAQIDEFWKSYGADLAEERTMINDIVLDIGKNGASRDLITSVSKAKSLADAVSIAGAYLSSGSGIVGEYQYYKRQAEELGMTPVDFQSYQDADANRKKVALGAGGLPSNISTQVDKLAAAFDSHPLTKQYNEVQNKKISVDTILQSGVKGPADLALVFEFMKALDPSSVVREAEYATAAQSGNIFAGWAAKFNGYLKEGGGFLPDKVKQDFQTIINGKFSTATSQYENLRQETARKIEMKTSQFDPNTSGTEYLTDYGAPAAAQDLIQRETKAKEKVIEIGRKNPQMQESISGILDDYPDATYQEVLQILGVPLAFSSVRGDTNKASTNRPQRNNNPLNIKASEATLAYPGVKGTDPSPASDGGKFLSFESPEAGFGAAKRLIKTSGYINLTVDAAMKRWSNSGYGGEIVPGLKGKTIKDLTDQELQKLLDAMAAREGYYA